MSKRDFINVFFGGDESSSTSLDICYVLSCSKTPQFPTNKITPGIPTTIKTMGVNITTIVYLRVLIIEIGSTIILMVVEAQGYFYLENTIMRI